MRLPWSTSLWLLFSLWATRVIAIAYRADLVSYNLNTNQNAQSVLEYEASRPNTTYTPSPTNWRALPFYTVLLDKFADGDPTNNDFFNTSFENDWRETGLRYGGDLKGLQSRLDYLYGMGVRAIFIAGTGFLNMPWQADSPYLFSSCYPHPFSPYHV
jgi:alpha-1,3-glucan synthase